MSKDKSKNYEIVGFNRVFSVKDGGMIPLDKVNPKTDIMKRSILPVTCSVYKVSASKPSVEVEVATPMVNIIGSLDGGNMSLVAAADIAKLGEIGGYTLGADGEIWKLKDEPSRSLDSSLNLQDCMNLNDTKMG